jgi:hypothetical protein
VTGVNIYLDDIFFELPAGTSTPTPIVATPTETFTPCVPSATFGKVSIGSFISSVAAAYPETSRYTLPSPGTVVSLSIYVGAVTGQLQLGVYSDTGTKPGTLLAVTAPFTPLASQWTTVPISPLALAAGNYYLAWQKETAGTEIHFDAGVDGDAYFAFSGNAFGSMPASYPTGTTDNMQWSIYANYCP